jgi:hypothetical protein
MHRTSSRGTGSALTRCAGDVERFLVTDWTRRPHHHNSGGGFADLLSLADVDTLLSGTFPRVPAFRLVRDGKVLDRSLYTRRAGLGSETLTDVADPGRIFAEFHGGATIVLQGLQRYWPPLTAFCRDLELTLTHPVQANAYITPPKSRGLGIHYDTHDVFVLQTAGSKCWDVHQCAIPFPLATQHGRPFGEIEPASLSLRLRAGDALYLPRGFLHQAVSTDEISIHLTIGVLSYTWWDLLRDVVSGAQEHPSFREPLPAGFAHDSCEAVPELESRVQEFKSWLDSVDLAPAVERLARRFWSSRAPSLGGHLVQLANLDAITDESVLQVRAGCSYYLYADGNELHVLLGDRALTMPAAIQPALEEMLRRAPFRIGDLSEMLDESSRLTLCRRLVKEGFFEATFV